MNDYMVQRINEAANYIVIHKSTIRDTAKVLGCCRSTIHLDVTKRLSTINPALTEEVKKVLEYNTSQRSHRGGATTRNKYKDK
ncbi:sporulation transcriptional regulator SpoIIID [Clostridium tertium]|uniref:sporulation transcriptional regulator SpoIIID n=1 Tax=Clostridium tertium TaxID=1559 RepID=UPI0023B27322|nr:sporulation transcriptional regulator SpoIIID [Clostridium tertium]